MTEGRSVAFVTGGRRGIGRGIAWALAEAGFDLVVNDLERDAAAEETLTGIVGRGGRGAFVLGDVADLDRHEALVGAAWQEFGRVDCLVNNAGVSVARRGDMLEASAASYDRVMGINLRGPFFLTQRVARRMAVAPADGRFRSVVNIASSNATIVSPDRAEYCLSKAGMAMMTQLYAVRLAEHGIHVYEVRPGIIRTDMTAVATEKYDRLIAGGITPIARWGEPADIGRAVAMLASGTLGFSTGEAIGVDGGLGIQRL